MSQAVANGRMPNVMRPCIGFILRRRTIAAIEVLPARNGKVNRLGGIEPHRYTNNTESFALVPALPRFFGSTFALVETISLVHDIYLLLQDRIPSINLICAAVAVEFSIPFSTQDNINRPIPFAASIVLYTRI